MKNGNLICLGTAVLVVGAIFWRWFLPGFFFTGDTGFFFNENLLSVYNIYLWKASYLLGFPNYALPRFLIDLVTVWPTWLVGLSFNDFTLKFLFFYPFLLLSCTGSFVFLRSMKISKIISSELSVLYVISTSSVAFLSMGHIHLMVPIALFPWLVYFWMKYLSFGLLRFSASSLFVLFISGLYDLRLAFLSTIFLLSLIHI